jgi:hypothetical protein
LWCATVATLVLLELTPVAPAPIAREEARVRGKRNPAWSLKGLREHYTSQRCSNCAFNDELSLKKQQKPVVRGRKRQTDPERREIWGVSYCTVCGTTWNRDVNAARNIHRLFLWMVEHNLVRHTNFQHNGALSAMKT